MTKLKSSPRAKLITTSNKIYFTFSGLFPHQFRQEYRGLIALEFEEQCRDAYAQYGPYGLIPLWWRALGDLAKGVAIERLKASHRKEEMTEADNQSRSNFADIIFTPRSLLYFLYTLIAAFFIFKLSFYWGFAFLYFSLIVFIIVTRIKNRRPTLNPPKET